MMLPEGKQILASDEVEAGAGFIEVAKQSLPSHAARHHGHAGVSIGELRPRSVGELTSST